jgi:hypothetical protein
MNCEVAEESENDKNKEDRKALYYKGKFQLYVVSVTTNQ